MTFNTNKICMCAIWLSLARYTSSCGNVVMAESPINWVTSDLAVYQ